MASLHDKNNPQTIRSILHTDFFLTFSTVLKTDRLPNPLTDISLTTSHPYLVCSTYTTDIIVADVEYTNNNLNLSAVHLIAGLSTF